MHRPHLNSLATFAKFEADRIRLRIRGGMKVARGKGRFMAKPLKLSKHQ
jgi:DNA invertase Pin-like site-specific DNA recombinase